MLSIARPIRPATGGFDRQPTDWADNRPIRRGILPLRGRTGRCIEADGRFCEQPAVDVEKRPSFVEHPAFSFGRTTFSVVQTASFSRRSAFFSRGIAFFEGVPSFFDGNLWMHRGIPPFPPATGESLEASGDRKSVV